MLKQDQQNCMYLHMAESLYLGHLSILYPDHPPAVYTTVLHIF
jgi:hypothetical protein